MPKSYASFLADRIIAAAVRGKPVPLEIQQAATRVQINEHQIATEDFKILWEYMGEDKVGTIAEQMMSQETGRALLRYHQAPFTNDQIEKFSTLEVWTWIYENHPPERRKDLRACVCFTGFSEKRKAELQSLAKSHFKVASSVTKGLHYLVTGENPGPSKVEKAQTQGTVLLVEKEFLDLLFTMTK